MSSSSFPHPSYNYHDNVSSYSYSLLNTKILVAAVTVLVIVIVFILALHVYARFFWSPRELAERRRSRRHRRPVILPIVREATLHVASNGEVVAVGGGGGGLEKAIVEALPTFEYRSAISGKEVEAGRDGQEVLECAVCLSEFKDMETGRVLPRCHHRFHTDCIGMWLFSHSTCPLCRASAHPYFPAIKIATTLPTSDLPSPSPVTPQEEEK